MSTSYNGWPADPNPAAIGVAPFGAGPITFPQGVKAGDVARVLHYVCDQIHRRVEPLTPGWNWGYSWKANANNPSQLSCHASGTAVDVSAPLHPNGAGGTWEDWQVTEIRKILGEAGNVVDWLEGYDEMHFEIQATPAEVAAAASHLPDTPTEDEVTGDDIDAIADAVMHRIRNDNVVSYNKTDAGSGKETQVKGSVTDAVGTAATYSGRAAYRATEADHQTE